MSWSNETTNVGRRGAGTRLVHFGASPQPRRLGLIGYKPVHKERARISAARGAAALAQESHARWGATLALVGLIGAFRVVRQIHWLA